MSLSKRRVVYRQRGLAVGRVSPSGADSGTFSQYDAAAKVKRESR